MNRQLLPKPESLEDYTRIKNWFSSELGEGIFSFKWEERVAVFASTCYTTHPNCDKEGSDWSRGSCLTDPSVVLRPPSTDRRSLAVALVFTLCLDSGDSRVNLGLVDRRYIKSHTPDEQPMQELWKHLRRLRTRFSDFHSDPTAFPAQFRSMGIESFLITPDTSSDVALLSLNYLALRTWAEWTAGDVLRRSNQINRVYFAKRVGAPNEEAIASYPYHVGSHEAQWRYAELLVAREASSTAYNTNPLQFDDNRRGCLSTRGGSVLDQVICARDLALLTGSEGLSNQLLLVGQLPTHAERPAKHADLEALRHQENDMARPSLETLTGNNLLNILKGHTNLQAQQITSDFGVLNDSALDLPATALLLQNQHKSQQQRPTQHPLIHQHSHQQVAIVGRQMEQPLSNLNSNRSKATNPASRQLLCLNRINSVVPDCRCPKAHSIAEMDPVRIREYKKKACSPSLCQSPSDPADCPFRHPDDPLGEFLDDHRKNREFVCMVLAEKGGGETCGKPMCPYAHNLQEFFGNFKYKDQQCRHHLRGNCNMLHRCMYKHGEDDPQYLLLNAWRRAQPTTGQE